jgi:hypothetical protein
MRDLSGLPTPVARYLSHVLPDERRANMLVPSRGELGWYHAGSWQKVWRGSVLESSYELTQ